MNVKKFIAYLFSPLAFAIGFLSPLIAQILSAVNDFAGINNLYIGLIIGISLGVMAQVRGSWIWVKPCD
jgi:hypothetical protein